MALQVVTFEGLVPGRYYHCIVKEGAEPPHGRLTYGLWRSSTNLWENP